MPNSSSRPIRLTSASAAKAASVDHHECLVRPAFCSDGPDANLLRNQGRHPSHTQSLRYQLRASAIEDFELTLLLVSLRTC